jgi:N-acetyl-anhydromuramyl-L-alanine amidase AmpD
MNAFKFIPIVLFLIFFNNEFSFSQVEKLNYSLKDLEYIEKTTYSSESVNTRIRFVVIHYTSTNWEQSLKILTKADYEVSSHYLIPESFDETYMACWRKQLAR